MTFVKTTWTDNALPAITAAQLNRIEQGVADAHAAAVWTNVDLNAATSYLIPWVAGARTLEVEMAGRASGTQSYAILGQPQGNGSGNNGRIVRNRWYVNSVDGTETSSDVFENTWLFDQGYALAVASFGSNPTDLLIRSLVDVVGGVSQSRQTLKGRGTSNSEMEGMSLDTFLYSPVVPTGMLIVLVNYNGGTQATFTGRLRYLMRA